MARCACVLAVAFFACSKGQSSPAASTTGGSPSTGPSSSDGGTTSGGASGGGDSGGASDGGFGSGANDGGISGGATDGGIGSGPNDGGTTSASMTTTLLETGIAQIQNVSPEGRRLLVSRTGSVPWGGLVLVTRGEASVEIAPQGASTSGFFTEDGTSIVFTIGDTGTAVGPSISVAHTDGSAARLLAARSSFRLQHGSWLYYSDDTDDGTSLYGVALPDGAPELIDSYSGTYNTYQAVWATASPTTDSIAYLFEIYSTEQPRLLPAGSSTPITLPARFDGLWAPDGSWLMLQGCQVTDMKGQVRPLCDPNWAVSSLTSNGSLFVANVSSANGPLIHVVSTTTGADTTLPPLPAVDENVFRPRFELGFTPDDSRVVAIEAHASFSIPSAGGTSWTMISPDHGATSPSASDWVRISPDSRIIADYSISTGTLVESIDGAAPVTLPGYVQGPVFEPLGGLGKAIFFDSFSVAWLANADGIGSATRLGRFWSCQWAARTAVCFAMHDDPNSIISNDVLAITDDGAQWAKAATSAVQWALQGRTLFYADSTGYLYAVDGLPSP